MRSRLSFALLCPLLCVLAAAPLAARSADPAVSPTAPATAARMTGAAEPAWIARPDGLEVQEIRPGDGAEARVGSMVEVHYTGWLVDGAQFDSSRDRGKPYAFRLGVGTVIQGWDQGIAGMRAGGIRRLRIPPGLAYGARGASDAIPPDATLLFEVELVTIR